MSKVTLRYYCRHCNVEIGALPFESAQEVLNLLQKFENKERKEHFHQVQQDGSFIIHSICEQCEQSLRQFPDYYMYNKWLQ